MRRMLIVAGLAAALASPASAGAALRHYTGVDLDGGRVEFGGRIVDGTVKRVRLFQWRNVPMVCDQGKSTSDGHFSFTIPVRERHFEATGSSQAATARVEGDFTLSARRAHGTLSVRGDFGPRRTNCRTGLDEWMAERRPARRG